MLYLPDIVTKSELDVYFKTISSNIKRIRLKKGMSQLEVALSIGQQSSGFYANAENYSHNKKFNLEHLCKLAKLFDVAVTDFFEPIKLDAIEIIRHTSVHESPLFPHPYNLEGSLKN